MSRGDGWGWPETVGVVVVVLVIVLAFFAAFNPEAGYTLVSWLRDAGTWVFNGLRDIIPGGAS